MACSKIHDYKRYILRKSTYVTIMAFVNITRMVIKIHYLGVTQFNNDYTIIQSHGKIKKTAYILLYIPDIRILALLVTYIL